MSDLLRLEGLTVDYGPVRAVHGLDLTVATGELVTLLGPNGAGKSSTIGAITGLVPSGGRIVFEGVDISRLPAEARVERGIAVSPEGRHVFANLTVAENLRLGAAVRKEPLTSIDPISTTVHGSGAYVSKNNLPITNAVSCIALLADWHVETTSGRLLPPVKDRQGL